MKQLWIKVVIINIFLLVNDGSNDNDHGHDFCVVGNGTVAEKNDKKSIASGDHPYEEMT